MKFTYKKIFGLGLLIIIILIISWFGLKKMCPKYVNCMPSVTVVGKNSFRGCEIPSYCKPFTKIAW
jgi:hypothetical protein